MKLDGNTVGIVTLVTSAVTMITVIMGCVIVLIYDNVNRITVPDFVINTIQSLVLLAVGTLGLHIQTGSNGNGHNS